MHLNEATYRALLDGTLPPGEARALAEHLEGDCEACERFLSERVEGDRLDGAVDSALVALAPPGAGAGNDLEYARIERTLRRPPPRRRLLPGLAVAATVAIAGLAGLLLARAPADRGAAWDGTKGTASHAIPLRLRFLVLTPGAGGPPGIEKGLSGQEVPAAASLQFQIELGRAAEVILLRADGAGNHEVFFRAHLPAGRTEVAVGGQPAAYPLATLAGSQRFLALASESPIDPADVARAARGAAARPDEPQPITLDQVEVKVRP
ncbi:MAG TPA: zf-HC2 domain-containing protein [Anaeromyxobacteraceae bacterium]|nr:zf-HC2 domain-containing protein [Anaeromyxobacteraceae bacterium]